MLATSATPQREHVPKRARPTENEKNVTSIAAVAARPPQSNATTTRTQPARKAREQTPALPPPSLPAAQPAPRMQQKKHDWRSASVGTTKKRPNTPPPVPNVKKPVVEKAKKPDNGNSDSSVVVQRNPREFSALKMGSEPVLKHDCACCYIDEISSHFEMGNFQTNAAYPSEARGVVHTLFAFRVFWVELYRIYLDMVEAAGSKSDQLQASFFSLLTRFGILENQRCHALVSSFDFRSTTLTSCQVQRPPICPNVQFVLQRATIFLLRAVDAGKKMAQAQRFCQTVVFGTVIYLHELGVRRQRNPACSDTLASLCVEYGSLRDSDDLLKAMEFQLCAPSSDILLSSPEYQARQANPAHFFCLELSSHVKNNTERICKQETVQLELMGAGYFSYEEIENNLCQILNRPRVAVSYRDYLWPGALGFRLENKRFQKNANGARLIDIAPPTPPPPQPPAPLPLVFPRYSNNAAPNFNQFDITRSAFASFDYDKVGMVDQERSMGFSFDSDL